jgi:putative heme-binding domain-containing protein
MTRWFVIFLLLSACTRRCEAVDLETQLLGVSRAEIQQRVTEDGNAARGAILFHRAQTACAKCHAVDAKSTALFGPVLTRPIEKLDAFSVAESILKPSAQIAEAYRTTQVITEDDAVVVGLSLETDKPNVLRLKLADLSVIDVPKDEIVEQRTVPTSLMPTGLATTLDSERDFYDLIRYVLEIQAGGAARARELAPTAAQLALPIPEYESQIDHAGMLSQWSQVADPTGRGDAETDGSRVEQEIFAEEVFQQEIFDRGKSVYESQCINCHGTLEKVGSLATAMQFGSGKFKFGGDPYSIYQTLTHGNGMMMPQLWMVPQQKYDVAYYLREHFLRPNNPSQYVAITSEYLSRLPIGDQFGPPPRDMDVWSQPDYGRWMINTIEIGDDGSNIAQKGIVVQLDDLPGGVAHANAWAMFEHDTLRLAGVWFDDSSEEKFIDWNGIHFNGRHNAHPRAVGRVLFQNPTAPGWANPDTGDRTDTGRVTGRDGRSYGPLPREWGQYQGLRVEQGNPVIDYRVGDVEVSERYSMRTDADGSHPVFVRSVDLGDREQELTMVVATTEETRWQVNATQSLAIASPDLAVAIDPNSNALLDVDGGQLHLTIAPGARQTLTLLTGSETSVTRLDLSASTDPIAGTEPAGVAAEPVLITTSFQTGESEQGFAVDVLTLPKFNPWQARVRLTGIDFYSDPNRFAVCSWDGDVWEVTHDSEQQTLQWQRIATGLFQPLGIKILDDVIYLTCRDQLLRLDDLDGDRTIDHYTCINSDHQVTEHFHEFAMGLQVDEDRNFYYAKSARHALKAIVPHHGTLLRISPDGSRTDILATGFRAANGVCLNPDGSFVVTDQEGHWNPKNRINWVRPGQFYGNMFGYHDVTDSSDDAMTQPLCWITNTFDRSPSELMWVDSPKWGPLNGALLNMSYGYGRLYIVPHESISTEGQMQGGMCALPIADMPTGLVRGRFSPHDDELYLCGMSAWASSQNAEEGGLYRVRKTGEPIAVPLGLEVHGNQIAIRFSEPLHASMSNHFDEQVITTWGLRRTANYGSDHYDEQEKAISDVTLSHDGRVLTLSVDDLEPTWGMEIRLQLITADGREVERVIHNTIHETN